MENENVNLDTSNETAGGEQESSEATQPDVKNLDAETLKEQNRQLFERAKKAEGQVKEFRAKMPKVSEAKPEAKPESNEPNYGRLAKIAYYKAEGITHSDDIKIVEDEASRLKLSPDEVFGMEHIKTRLKVNQDARNAQAGLPAGSQRAGGTTQHDVDYWVQKGTGLPEEQELAEKVVEARMGRDSSQRKFDPIRS